MVTSEAYADLVEDERQLVAALTKRGVTAIPAVWSDSSIDWSSFDVALIRSAWDYHLRSDQFFAWVERARLQTRIINDPDLMRWNSDKHYLLDLHAHGVPIVPTMFIEPNAPHNISAIVAALGTDEMVVKPALSANSHGLTIIADGHASFDSASNAIERILATGTAMVQPFLREVYDLAERSLIYFNGKFSHAAIRQVAKVDDLSLRPPVAPSPSERELAEHALATLPQMPLYARVDIIPRYAGDSVLSELELIEPSLFLMSDPASVDRFADAIVSIVA